MAVQNGDRIELHLIVDQAYPKDIDIDAEFKKTVTKLEACMCDTQVGLHWSWHHITEADRVEKAYKNYAGDMGGHTSILSEIDKAADVSMPTYLPTKTNKDEEIVARWKKCYDKARELLGGYNQTRFTYEVTETCNMLFNAGYGA